MESEKKVVGSFRGGLIPSTRQEVDEAVDVLFKLYQRLPLGESDQEDFDLREALVVVMFNNDKESK